MFSLRDLMKYYPNAKQFTAMMTTSTIGRVIPEFIEQYGENKNIDLVLSPSHNLFLDGFPDAKMTGVYMDKNGNWKFQINLPIQINIETLPSMWEPARNMYMTFVLKMKLAKNDTNPFDKKFVFTPRNIEMSQMKVMKNGEVMEMEGMMIQSMVNIQMDQAKKMFKEIPGKMNTLLKKFPPELECYGFRVSDLDIAYKKSQMQTSAYFKEVPADRVNATMCEEFNQKLNEHPEQILKQLKGDKESPFNKAYE